MSYLRFYDHITSMYSCIMRKFIEPTRFLSAEIKQVEDDLGRVTSILASLQVSHHRVKDLCILRDVLEELESLLDSRVLAAFDAALKQYLLGVLSPDHMLEKVETFYLTKWWWRAASKKHPVNRIRIKLQEMSSSAYAIDSN